MLLDVYDIEKIWNLAYVFICHGLGSNAILLSVVVELWTSSSTCAQYPPSSGTESLFTVAISVVSQKETSSKVERAPFLGTGLNMRPTRMTRYLKRLFS